MEQPKSRDARALRTYALTFPEAREDFPWGERVVKVREKVFVFLGGTTRISESRSSSLRRA
jgi:hypothetical protein